MSGVAGRAGFGLRIGALIALLFAVLSLSGCAQRDAAEAPGATSQFAMVPCSMVSPSRGIGSVSRAIVIETASVRFRR